MPANGVLPSVPAHSEAGIHAVVDSHLHALQQSLEGLIGQQPVHSDFAADLAPHPYVNTSLEEPRTMSGRLLPFPVLDADETDDEGYNEEEMDAIRQTGDETESESGDDFENGAEARQMRQEARVLRREMARLNLQAEQVADQLHFNHFNERALLNGFRHSVGQLKTNDNAVFVELKQHMLNAFVVAKSDVRRFDIITWHKSLPQYVLQPLQLLVGHYHNEAKLRLELSNLEGREIDWSEDEVESEELAYAAKRASSHPPQAGFGYEVHYHSRPPWKFVSQSEGRKQLKYMLAELEVRLVRLSTAGVDERFGRLPFENSLDEKMTIWMDGAVKHIEKKIKDVIVSGKELSREARVAMAWDLTTGSDFDIYNDVKEKLKSARIALNSRVKHIKELKEAKVKHAAKLAEVGAASVLENDVDGTYFRVDEEAQELALEVDDLEAKLDGICGGRVRWQW